tara:strand:- start:135 stop:701 length:567 start_codon:yes stop_codon:yes gene_type:complete
MEANNEPESLESVSTNSEGKVKKLSHVCIFTDCKKGKRGGSEYCNHHRKIGEEGRKKLNLELENNNLRRKEKSQPSVITDPYEMDISNIDLESDKDAILIVGIILLLSSFIASIIAIKSDDSTCGMFGLFQFVIGILVVSSITKDNPKGNISLFISIIVFFVVLFMIYLDDALTGVGGAADFSGWGGP